MLFIRLTQLEKVLGLQCTKMVYLLPYSIIIKLKKKRGSFDTSYPLTGEKAKELQARVLKILKKNQASSGLWKNGADG